MAIEEDSKPLGSSKIDDITRLIQLYMVRGLSAQVGVEALEGHEDQRFRFFSRKLQTLMLKKPVAEQLRSAANMPLHALSPQRQQEKRQEHEIQLMYNQEVHERHRVRELVQNVEEKLKSYQGIVHRQIKKQEDQIRERIQLRKLKSDSGNPRSTQAASRSSTCRPTQCASKTLPRSSPRPTRTSSTRRPSTAK